MEQPKKEPSTTLIYVSNLPFETTDEQFRDLFKGFTVKTAYVAKRKNGKSKGFGFVNLEKESDQKAAIEKVNGLEFEKRKLIAKVAMNDDRRNEKGELKEEFKTATTNTQQPPSETVVYVSNLAWTVTDEELRKIFAEFNPKTVTVATRKNGRSKGFGFVEFNSKEDREKALSLDQKTFSERQISVKQSTGFREKRTDNNNNSDRKGRNNNNRRSKSPRRNRDNNNRRSKSPRRNRDNNNNRRSKSPRRNNNNNNSNNNNNRRNDNNRTERKRSEFALYVKNLPFELDDQDLRDVFKDFHPTAANIASRGGKSRGFGFVEFGNAKDRDDAQRNLDQSEINDRLVSVTVSSPSNNNRDNNRGNNNNNRDNNRENRPRRTDRSPRRQRDNSNRQASSSTVHVSNLEFSIDDKALEEVFTGLKIVKAYVARTQSGRSKGFGFVEFKTAEDQQNSLKKNGSEVKGRPIKVQASYVKEENKSN